MQFKTRKFLLGQGFAPNSSGVSLIEMVVVLAVIIILGMVGVSSFQGLNDRQAVEKAALTITGVLDEARSLTLGGKDSSQYGVHFATSTVTLFVGSSYSSSDPSNQVNILDQQTSIHTINLAGGSNVVFDRLVGTTINSGTVVVVAANDSAVYKTVRIYATGVAQIE